MPKLAVVIRDSQLLNDPLRPYVPQHSVSFDFTEFANIGAAFVTEVARVFAMRAGGRGKNTGTHDYYTLKLILGWIQANSKSFPTFRRKLFTNYQSILVDEWEVVLNTWRDELVNAEHRRRETSRGGIIRNANVLIETFVGARIMRSISRLAPVKYSNKKATPKKCLAEVSLSPSLNPTNGQLHCDAGTVPLNDNPSPEDPKEIIKGRTDDHIQTIASLNKKRLDDLRRCAEQELKQWSDHFEEGQRLLGLCDMSFSAIRKILHTRYSNNVFRGQALSKLFPKNLPDTALSRYLTYILHEHGGLLPFGSKTRLRSYHSHFCKWRGRLEGMDRVRAYLIPHVQAANAIRVIFLIDTGANVAVCHSLNRDCLSDSDVRGHKAIAGFKDRARGKLIVSELPINDARHEISCVQALTRYQEMSKRLTKLAPSILKERLFLRASVSGVKAVSYSSAGKQFKAFLSRHEEFQGLDLQADLIRPTVLFQTFCENEGNLVAANALADHGALSTTSLYANKPSLRLVYERLMREFQQLFQVVSISDIDGAALRLQMKKSQYQRLLKKAHRTGLGVACLNPKAGYQPETIKGKDCVTLEKCPSCPLRFVVATVPNITDLILFYHHLRASRPEFEATRPQRWLQTWLPWLVFAEVALEKVQRGPAATIFLKAKMAAELRISAGTANFPPLW